MMPRMLKIALPTTIMPSLPTTMIPVSVVVLAALPTTMIPVSAFAKVAPNINTIANVMVVSAFFIFAPGKFCKFLKPACFLSCPLYYNPRAKACQKLCCTCNLLLYLYLADVCGLTNWRFLINNFWILCLHLTVIMCLNPYLSATYEIGYFLYSYGMYNLYTIPTNTCEKLLA